MVGPRDQDQDQDQEQGRGSRLRRELGTLESYAALVGILVGAGIFKVTGVASDQAGPAVVLGYVLLAPVIFATSAAYVVFVSTRLGREGGGDYAHVRAALHTPRLAFVLGWLKIISYIGAAAYLATGLADYLLELDAAAGDWFDADAVRLPIALGSLVFFFFVHACGVRWFGRLQVWMCALLAVSILVLVVPGFFAMEAANFRPFLPHGWGGLGRALPPLFFAFAGFEALAHAGAEVRDSARMPGVFLRGIAISTVIFVSMSVVAFGVLSADELARSEAPMARAAAEYLPFGAAAIVTLGGILAVATSLNATMLVPARLGLVLARDGHLPGVLGQVHANRGTPVVGLLLSFGLAAILVVSGQIGMTLNVAVFALMLVYAIHGLALWFLPARNPELAREVQLPLPLGIWRAVALLSVVALVGLVVSMVWRDLGVVRTTSLAERFAAQELTGTELLVFWSLIGLAVRGRLVGRSG